MSKLLTSHFAPPATRRLRVFAFDPSLGRVLETLPINQSTLNVPWEVDHKTGENRLHPGPIGEYLEVIDIDPASRCRYEPVNLNDPQLLAQDGVAPSEGCPQFHQQMVYAVAMTTIKYFERALGRRALWAPLIERDADGKFKGETYVPRLRIYPHALRQPNAYYSPKLKALLFGYFPAPPDDTENIPGTPVFSCLSHDIIAHETTHALLDGVHPRFGEPTNPDVLAFHEAFADLVALFQHFSNPDVLRHQIAGTRGDLASQNLLGELAQQFGRATGCRGALRRYLGQVENGRWEPLQPDPNLLRTATTPHKRGSILVAAVFRAFVSIYKERVADLIRIATQGTGILPPGDIHPDLVNRLARTAAETAEQFLVMCIRALDYCPPVDITFGDYLRAVITADRDLNPDDPENVRVALSSACRAWGIYPAGAASLAADALAHPRLDQLAQQKLEGAPQQPAPETARSAAAADGDPQPQGAATNAAEAVAEQAREPGPLESLVNWGLGAAQQALGTAVPGVAALELLLNAPVEQLNELQKRAGELRTFEASDDDDSGEAPTAALETPAVASSAERQAAKATKRLRLDWDLETDREQVYKDMDHNRSILKKWFHNMSEAELNELGLTRAKDAPPTVFRGGGARPTIEVHSVRKALRRGREGGFQSMLVVEATQRRRGYFGETVQAEKDKLAPAALEGDEGEFRFRRGCTLLINPATMQVRYIIKTAGTVADTDELKRVRAFLARKLPQAGNGFTSRTHHGFAQGEEFAMLHALAE